MHKVSTSPVSETLASPFFTMIQENVPMRETHDHPCALSANAGKLKHMAAGLGANRTVAADSAPVQKLIELAVP